MTFKNFEWRILLRVIFLLFTLTGLAFLISRGEYPYLVAVLPILVIQVVDFYKIQLKAHRELNQFVEGIHYRDFSRYFDEKSGSLIVQPLRKGFNEINSTFKVIAKEKETQYQYLQKVLELVETGIISYEEESEEVVWINEAIKKILKIPYLKSLQAISKRYKNLYNDISSLKPGESRIIELKSESTEIKVLASATAFQTDGKRYKLVAFQNVNEALEETESNAWQKLLSVLTHEIMNSIAPISSLADTLKNRLQTFNYSEPNEDIEDIELGMETIKRRSEGLLKFAETYRTLNKISNPTVKQIQTHDLFNNITHLMEPTLKQKNIDLEVNLKDPTLTFQADVNLIEQVLINLILNAIDAVKEKVSPRILLTAYLSDQKRMVIKVADNGPGMSEELLDKIFIPFFSTKKTGSGIGLTLSKQIMRLHKGNIRVISKVNEGTAFLLEF
jgi:two-component system, NtrC family, nitrogen regulation sensor histidine kinase NtrY